jgi:hypothetical protein
VLIRVLASAALIFWLLSAATAVAAPDPVKQRAQQLLTEGNKLARAGDFGPALVKFRTAHELYPSPKLLLNIGTSLRHMGRYSEAIETYARYLEDPDFDNSRVEELRVALDELGDLVGTVEINSDESDIRVSLDGRLLRDFDGSINLSVDPGRHTIVAEKTGREPTVKHFSVEAKQRKEVTLLFAKPGEALPDPTPPRRILGIALAALGGGAVVASGIVGIAAITTRSEADNHCPDQGRYNGFCSPEGAELTDDARTLGSAATATFIVGFIMAGSGLALAFAPDDDDEDQQQAALVVGPGHVGVKLTW